VGIVVRLTRVDERLLTPLLSVAVAETKPDEVMPPVEAPPGWSQPRRDAFCEFYRSHYRGLNGPTRTLTYGILCNSDVVGMIRMARSDGPDTLETGMWLGRSARGRGIGGRALRLLLDEAAHTGPAASWPKLPRPTPRRSRCCAAAVPCLCSTARRFMPRSPSGPQALPLTPNPTADGCEAEIAAQDTLSCALGSVHDLWPRR